jgi:hypothetical protein
MECLKCRSLSAGSLKRRMLDVILMPLSTNEQCWYQHTSACYGEPPGSVMQLHILQQQQWATGGVNTEQ